MAGERRAHDVADDPNRGLRLLRNEGRPWELVAIENVSNPDAGRKR